MKIRFNWKLNSFFFLILKINLIDSINIPLTIPKLLLMSLLTHLNSGNQHIVKLKLLNV